METNVGRCRVGLQQRSAGEAVVPTVGAGMSARQLYGALTSAGRPRGAAVCLQPVIRSIITNKVLSPERLSPV